MWGLVHFPESNDYCVLKSTQVHEGHFAVGETISVLYKAKLLYVNSCKSLCDREVRNCSATRAPKYPYRLTKERADDIQKSATSVTHFARVAERELFAGDKDRHLNIAERVSQDKVRWLREMVKYRFPSVTPAAEATAWAACVRAINSYHRRSRTLSPIRPISTCNVD
ncbi:hypothetical protein Aduo_005590 [Ancylostoma duodenale]